MAKRLLDDVQGGAALQRVDSVAMPNGVRVCSRPVYASGDERITYQGEGVAAGPREQLAVRHVRAEIEQRSDERGGQRRGLRGLRLTLEVAQGDDTEVRVDVADAHRERLRDAAAREPEEADESAEASADDGRDGERTSGVRKGRTVGKDLARVSPQYVQNAGYLVGPHVPELVDLAWNASSFALLARHCFNLSRQFSNALT